MTTLTGPVPLSDDHPDELLSRAISAPLKTDSLSLEEIYEIERTKKLLKEGNFRTVALQFPDEILHDAAKVSKRLQEGLEGVKIYILADTSYGRLTM
jgi:diphthamide biosynthesis protein 2